MSNVLTGALHNCDYIERSPLYINCSGLVLYTTAIITCVMHSVSSITPCLNVLIIIGNQHKHVVTLQYMKRHLFCNYLAFSGKPTLWASSKQPITMPYVARQIPRWLVNTTAGGSDSSSGLKYSGNFWKQLTAFSHTYVGHWGRTLLSPTTCLHRISPEENKGNAHRFALLWFCYPTWQVMLTFCDVVWEDLA